MKQILYMAGEPIQHPGVAGRELPLKPATEFNDIECEHIFVAAGRIENFINHISRFNPVADSFREFLEAVEGDCTRTRKMRKPCPHKKVVSLHREKTNPRIERGHNQDLVTLGTCFHKAKVT